jgi:acid stress-induced BolA-like protein IbaG/YrbA
MEMITAENVKTYIETALPCEYVEVEGDDGRHFNALIVSAQFSGKNTVQQHQMVYQSLGDKMKQDIHALSIKTFTPEQWAGQS